MGIYAAAAGATVASASSAEANIIYIHPTTPVESTLSNGPSYGGYQIQHAPFTMNGWLAKVGNVNGTFGSLRIAGAGISGAETYNGLKFFGPGVSSFALAKFAPGAPIGGSSRAFFGVAKVAQGTASPFGTLRAFPIGQTGFAGIDTPNGRLGWVRLEVLDRNSDGYPDATEAIDWAYNTIPGAEIVFGGNPRAESISLRFARYWGDWVARLAPQAKRSARKIDGRSATSHL